MTGSKKNPQLAKAIRKDLAGFSSNARAKILQRFFKTSPGEYAEGDKFIGVKVPDIRILAGKYVDLREETIQDLLRSPIHEERLLALLVLIAKLEKTGNIEKKQIYQLYLKNIRHIDNWDLVDLSAPQIVGAYLADKNKKPLYRLARSRSLWQRRIAIISTFSFIRRREFRDTLNISRILLKDKEDLIHKAVGWMLREVGKRSQVKLEQFLNNYGRQMARTTLRYAIERFPEKLRQEYLFSSRN